MNDISSSIFPDNKTRALSSSTECPVDLAGYGFSSADVPQQFPKSRVYTRDQYIAVYRGYRATLPANEIASTCGLTSKQVQICVTALIRCGALQRNAWADRADEASVRPVLSYSRKQDELVIPAPPQPAVSEALVRGQLRLWRKVIVQALYDAIGKIQMTDVGGKHEHALLIRDRARTWFIDGGRNFRHVCDLAGWCPEWVQKRAIALVQSLDSLTPDERAQFIRAFGMVGEHSAEQNENPAETQSYFNGSVRQSESPRRRRVPPVPRQDATVGSGTSR